MMSSRRPGTGEAPPWVLNCLAALAAGLGTLDAIESVVKLTGYVASAEGFEDHPP